MGHNVYLYRNEADEIIYVGSTRRGRKRVLGHGDDWWWSDVRTIEVLHLANAYEVEVVEKILIDRLRDLYEPLYNGRVPPGPPTAVTPTGSTMGGRHCRNMDDWTC